MKKALHIIKNIAVWLVVILAIGMMVFTVVSVNTFDRRDRGVFGYQFYVVQTDSMSKTDFSAGDIVITKQITDPSMLKEGDVITFISQNSESFGETVTHKIRKLTTDANGEPGFITYGTTTDTDDAAVVTYPYVLGRYTGRIPNVGAFFQFLKTTPGYVLCILIPFLLLIGYNGLRCIQLFRRYKREQMEELEAEKAQLAEERKQTAEMMEELQALRAQLAGNGAPAAEVPEETALEPTQED